MFLDKRPDLNGVTEIMAKIDRVQEVSTELLKPYENNAKIHTDDQINKIAESIKEFGFLNPCLIDKEYRILAGHGRVMAAKKLGMDTVPCVYIEGLNEAQRRAYILADNRLAELAEWDMNIVDQEIEELYGDGYDVTLTGFDYDDILAVENVRDDDFGIDDTDWEGSPAQEAPKSKPRQIWQLGEHRLMCGDSTDPEDVAALMDGAQVDLLLTDPPYNVDVGSCDRPNSQYNNVGILNDNMHEADFIQFLTAAFKAAEMAMKPGAAFYVWYAGLKHIPFESAIRNIQTFKLREQLIWVKAHFVLGRNSDYQWMHECCLYGWKEGAPHYFIDSRAEKTVIEDRDAKLSTLKKEELIALVEKYRNADRSTTVLRAEKPNAAELHPTVKPQALLVEQIKNSTRRGGYVLDLFGGSGSTMIAAEQMGRRCYMMELDPHYCDVIIKRWEDFTGKKAELL